MFMSFNFGEEILIIKGSPNGFYSYFGGFKHLDCYNIIVCCSLDPVWVISYVILVMFLDIQWNFSKLKKHKFGTLNLGQVILGKQLF